MAQLNNCPHCGSETEFIMGALGSVETLIARCTNCKIQTQPITASLEYSAVDRIAGIWNNNQTEEWVEWVQPKGAHDAYSKGSKVQHTGKKWISSIDANVWEPGVTGWTKQ
jgi:hypothetical protein